MRVFRPTYSIPRPSGGKVLKRKDGDYLKFASKRGEEAIGKLTKSGKRVALPTSHYSAEFRDGLGTVRRLKGFTDRASTERVAATVQDLLNCLGSGQGVTPDLRKRIEALPARMQHDLATWGLLDAKASMAAKPLGELITGYTDHLRALERNRRYVKKTEFDLQAIFQDCHFSYLSDVDGRAIEAYLMARRDEGISYRRSNSILGAVKGFCNWLVREQVITSSPVAHVRPLNVKQDRRLIRRALEVDELRRLLATTKQSEIRYGLTGHERYLVYKLAVETGLRRGELDALVVGNFHFETLTLELDPRFTKNKKGGTLPLRKDTAQELQTYFGSKSPTAKAFPPVTPWRSADLVALDLDAAGIPYKDEAGRVFDFHSLRHQCGTMLAQAGVHPKTAQTIMRHHDINLTMSLYTHTLRGQESQAVNSLPNLSDSVEGQQERKAG